MDIDKNNKDLTEDAWNAESIKTVELKILNSILECKTVMAVETSISFARFLRSKKITNNNYPIILYFLEIENHWVIDSLIGDNDPFLFLNSIPPNNYIILSILRLLTKNHPKIIYHKTLSILLGYLEYIYSSPEDGYVINSLNFTDINNICKYLIKEKNQDYPNNKCIINILNHLGSLEGKSEDPNMEQMSRQANNITECFINQKKKMEDIIPHSLLTISENILKEIPPEYVYSN